MSWLSFCKFAKCVLQGLVPIPFTFYITHIVSLLVKFPCMQMTPYAVRLTPRKKAVVLIQNL